MRRPGLAPPQWAWNAPGGAVLAPAEGTTEVGYAAGNVPPAMWFNYHFNLYGQWLGYLAGPSLTAWSPWPLPAPATAFAPPHFAAVDVVTTDTTEARYRYAVAAVDATSACVLVSRGGQDWVLRRNLPGDPTDAPLGIVAGNAWALWTEAAIYTAILDSGVGTSPLRSAGTDWGTASLPMGHGDIRGVAYNGNWIATTSTDILYSNNVGTTYFAVVVPGRQAGRAIAYGAVPIVEISSNAGDGYIVRCAGNVSAPADWVHVQTLAGAGSETTWRLAVGPVADDDTTTFAAYKTGTANPRLHVSEDDGVTWTVVPVDVAPGVPVSLGNLTSLAYRDGVWLATSTTWPYAWTSSDLERWLPVAVPVSETDSPLYDVAFGNGSWLLVGESRVLQGAPAVDASPEGYTPSTRSAVLGDAGWLRGYKISVTAPADGDALVFDAAAFGGAGGWVPTAAAVAPTLPWSSAAAPGAVQTTDATVTTLATIATTTDRGHLFEVRVLATKHDRSAIVGWTWLVAVTNAAGVVTLRDAAEVRCTDPASTLVHATTPVTFDVSGTSVRVRGTGAAATTIDWSEAHTTLLGGT